MKTDWERAACKHSSKTKAIALSCAATGLQGIEAARRFRPQVVLCDIGLPELDGYSVARRLRQESDLQNIRLIAISGYADEADKNHALRAGFDSI
jgi:CheY-like chemotaxis protein